MTENPAEHSIREQGNPFSGVPAVRLDQPDQVGVYIPTEASRRAMDEVESHRTTLPGGPRERERHGRVITIIGELGSGKSHLAVEILNAMQSATLKNGPSLVVVTLHMEVGDSLLKIYRRLFGTAKGGDGDRRLRSGDATAGTLTLSAVEAAVRTFMSEVQRELAADNVIPIEPAPDTGDVELVSRLRKRLTTVTGYAEYANALSLLLHEDQTIAEGAWRWLRALPLRAAEQERLVLRGVSHTLDRHRALSALSALSKLFGAAGRYFVLALDEMQFLWTGTDRAKDEAADVLNPLLTWAEQTGVLLVVCGLADFWKALPGSVHDRAGLVLWPTPLTLENVFSYIESALFPMKGAYSLAPFDRESAGLIHRITGGHPRRTIDLCHHAYENARGSDRVTTGHVRKASADLSGPENPEQAMVRIAERCAQSGHNLKWRQPRHYSEPAVPDLWIDGETADARLGIVVTGAVLDEADASPVVGRGLELQAAHYGATVLVVVGMLAESVSADVGRAFSRVLLRGQPDFDDALIETIEAFLPRLEQRAERAVLNSLREDVQALGNRMQSTQRLLSEEIREILLREMRQRQAPPAPAEELGAEFGDDHVGSRLAQLFDEVHAILRKALRRDEQLWRAMFVSSDEDAATFDRLDAPGRRRVASGDLTAKIVGQATDTLFSLDKLVAAFAWSVAKTRENAHLTGQSPRQELRQKCDRFDSAANVLLARFPTPTEDAGRIILRALNVDQTVLTGRIRNLGQVVYDIVHDEEFRVSSSTTE